MKTIQFHGDRLTQKPDLYFENLTAMSVGLPVGVILTVKNIEKVSSEHMDLALSFVLKQRWVDRRLAHYGKEVKLPTKYSDGAPDGRGRGRGLKGPMAPDLILNGQKSAVLAIPNIFTNHLRKSNREPWGL